MSTRRSNAQEKSGRRNFMSDYGPIENVPIPYSARRSGANPVYPLNIFNKQQLDNESDKVISPKSVITERNMPRRTEFPFGVIGLRPTPTGKTVKENLSALEYSDLE